MSSNDACPFRYHSSLLHSAEGSFYRDVPLSTIKLPSSNKKPKQGIRVSTLQKVPLEISNFTSDDAPYEADRSLFALRCLKRTNIIKDISLTEPRTSGLNVQYSEQEILEKLVAIQNVRLTKKILEKQMEGSGSKRLRFFLEDADENLDFAMSDDESFHLDSLAFNVTTEEGALNIGCRSPGIIENASFISEGLENAQNEKGFEFSEMRRLRNKAFNVQMKSENGGVKILGKVDYSMRKYRIYDQKDRLLYKIHRTSSNDPKTQVLSIKNNHELEVGRIVIMHTGLNTAKCEASLPEKSDSRKKLLIISTLFTIMEKFESFKGNYDEVSPQKSVFSSIFSFLSCQHG